MCISNNQENANADKIEKWVYTGEEIGKLLGIGRTSAYGFVKEGHAKVVRIGSTIRVSKRSFDEWLDSLGL